LSRRFFGALMHIVVAYAAAPLYPSRGVSPVNLDRYTSWLYSCIAQDLFQAFFISWPYS
jgi:hypothetical protein